MRTRFQRSICGSVPGSEGRSPGWYENALSALCVWGLENGFEGYLIVPGAKSQELQPWTKKC